ncbi:MAG: UDP pyrophosphate phosphatase [Pseudomonadota bacterium]
MIGGLNPNNSFALQSGNNSPVRERSDVARAPASAPERSAEGVRRDLTDARGETTLVRRVDSDSLERRVEARRAAEDARLERFRADELPLATSRALSTFTDIAARGDAGENGLAGIDILV